MSEDIQTALLTRSEIEWLLGKRQLSKHYERKMRVVPNKKLRTWEQLERPLLEAQGFLAATTDSSGIGRYSHYTVRSSIADERVAPLESEQNSDNYYDNHKMLRPGFEPGISDSKGIT